MNANLDLDALNAASPPAFVAAVGPLFEVALRFLARLAGARPFADWPSLFAGARSIAHGMPERDQIELINAHPRLGADPGSVSALSLREQGYDRVPAPRADAAADPEAPRVAAELDRLNAAYEARFGFRYCVFVAGRSRAELLPEMRSALERDRASELRRALDAVVDIAQARRAALQGDGG